MTNRMDARNVRDAILAEMVDALTRRKESPDHAVHSNAHMTALNRLAERLGFDTIKLSVDAMTAYADSLDTAN